MCNNMGSSEKRIVAYGPPAASSRWTSALVLAAVLWPLAAVAQERTDTSVTVTVEVVDRSSGRPLSDVAVLIPKLGIHLVSDAAGHAVIQEIAVGSYEMILTRPGYKELRGDFTVDRGGSFQVGLSVLTNMRLVGRVEAQEDGAPLVGAIVRVEGLGPVLTDDDGRFQMADVPPGRHAVEVEYLGRSPVSDTLVLERGELVGVVIRLENSPIPLEGLEVVVEQRSIGLESAGFYDRRDRWQVRGARLTREDIEEFPRPRLADYMINIPGTRIERRGIEALMKVTRYGGLCDPITYVDGVRMGIRYDLNTFSPDAIEGVEVYVGQRAPIRFQSNACGTVLLWTRAYR